MLGAEMADRVTSWTWWPMDRQPFGRAVGSYVVGATRVTRNDEVFVWRHGRADVTLAREGDHWRVAYAAAGRLLGPRRTIHEARHRRSDMAVWDVMARVTKACRNESIAVRVAHDAAHWMNDRETTVDA